ncbi:site-specific integrase [Furfurilactobacillus entadae]|uniref:site-specific integrase n=1 Tax=Furfurilactobacillus entadae TaxID=2922307 RepID=UPI0035EBEBB1
MASITKRSNGKYQARAFYYARNGERKAKAKTFPSKIEAQRWAEQMDQQKLVDDGIVESKQSFYDYFMEWYETYEESKIAPATQQWYRNTQRIIKENFGRTKLVAIKRSGYQQFLNEFGATHSRESSMKVDTHVKMAIRSAMDDGLLKRDFTAHTSITGNDGKDKALKYLDGASMWKLINYSETKITPEAPSYAMILTALFTGMRIAEVAGLQEQDFDVINQTLQVENTYDWTTHGFKPTKNVQSRRTISINDELSTRLTALFQAQQALEIHNPNKLLFVNENGVVPSNNGVNKVLKSACQKLHIKEVTFHALRHTHASYLLSQDVSIYEISERLGHKNFTTTLNIYSHLQQEFKAQQNQKVSAAFSRTKFIDRGLNRSSIN